MNKEPIFSSYYLQRKKGKASSYSTFHRPEKDPSRSALQQHHWYPQRIWKTNQTRPDQVETSGWFLSNIWPWLESSFWVISTHFKAWFLFYSASFLHPKKNSWNTGVPVSAAWNRIRKKPSPVWGSLYLVCVSRLFLWWPTPWQTSWGCGLSHQGHSHFSQASFKQQIPSFHDF